MIFNSEIEEIFNNFTVDGEAVPVSYMRYDGHGEPYITYLEMDNDGSFSADDSLAGYIVYYDIDIYSKGNYTAIAEKVIEVMETAGWTWQPSRSSSDMFEDDTGYFHKTLNFAKEREV